MLREGRVVGDYVLVGELGRGGFGVVYEAEDARDGTRVALKTLRADLSSSQGQRALTRFLLEVRAVRQLKHPNVVQYIDAGQLNGEDGSVLAYYAMELLQGETLDQLVKRNGPMAPKEAANVIRQAAVGLHTAHAQGIIHRDVKPGNIMLAPSGRAVVTDFGVCKILELQNVTTAGQVVGTARYLSPEQFLGATLDARSDVFSLGALFFYLLTGEHLRIHKDLVLLSRQVAGGEDVRRVKEAKDIPAPLRKVLLNSVAREPSHRYQNALMLAHALEEAQLNREVSDRKAMVNVRPQHTPVPQPIRNMPARHEERDEDQDDGHDEDHTEHEQEPTRQDIRMRPRAHRPLTSDVATELEVDAHALLGGHERPQPPAWQLALMMAGVAVATATLLAWCLPNP